MKKVKSITLRNFKFFYGTENRQAQNKLGLNGDNLLLYGENGSGKSSIYWALYTFLQSSLKKEQVDIEKYFDPNDNQNLRNRFANNDDESGIEVEFQSNLGEITKKLRRKNDGTYEINSFNDREVRKVLEGSDFINYKFLSKIYDFRNSEFIDLFPMFERDLFMFINFEQAYLNHNGELSTETYADSWWSFICDSPNQLPHNGNIVSVGSEEYKRLKTITIPKFIELLKQFLTEINQGVNELLLEKFGEQFSIDFDVESITCDYNKNISQRAKDGKIHQPIIPLRVKFNHDVLLESNKIIEKPHTFLNEARLTAIGLAIRLEILDRRPQFEDTARILVLDDLLLSLDMSHRDKVLDIFLSDTFIDIYQLMILTHDRSFYNLCKRRIQDRFVKGWTFKEVYQHTTDDGIPCPFIPDQRNYLDLAKKYLKEFDYPASANYLRKECERILKHLLPQNLSIYTSDEGTKVLQLDNLILNFLKYYSEILGGDISPFKKLKEYKDLLLNPLSHDNIQSPIYKLELLNIIDILTNLNILEVIVIGDASESQSYELRELDVSNDIWCYKFLLCETWRGIRDLNGLWNYSNPLIKLISRQNLTKEGDVESFDYTLDLNHAYQKIRFKLEIRKKLPDGTYEDNVKEIKDIIFRDGNIILN